jgi:NAD(P)-dependent dehydrogenase (short-subunit alcohol dehydrogenase family)
VSPLDRSSDRFDEDAMSMHEQLVVITGVGREGQVGEAVAATLAAHGATLALIDVDGAQAAARAATLHSAGAAARGYAVDLTDMEATTAIAARIVDDHPSFGGIHTLVCLAGGFAWTGALDASDFSHVQRQLSINLMTAFSATRAFLPALRRVRGNVVYMGSVAALPGADVAGTAAYAAAKAGVLSLMRSVSQGEREHGVRANAVAPSAIRTAANVAEMGDGQRYVSREAVAEAVLWLASGGASEFVTGQVVVLG